MPLPDRHPIGTVPRLDKNLEAVAACGQSGAVSAGSRAVRNAIMKHQPLLGSHRHVHEPKGFCPSRRTICPDSGSEYGKGVLRCALIRLSKKGIKN